MPYIHFSEQEKELAKQADIVQFLQVHGEQVKRTGKEFAWDSPAGKVTIRENQWYSQYEQTGGGAIACWRIPLGNFPKSFGYRVFASYKRFREFLIAIGIYKVQKIKSHFVQTNNSIKS